MPVNRPQHSLVALILGLLTNISSTTCLFYVDALFGNDTSGTGSAVQPLKSLDRAFQLPCDSETTFHLQGDSVYKLPTMIEGRSLALVGANRTVQATVGPQNASAIVVITSSVVTLSNVRLGHGDGTSPVTMMATRSRVVAVNCTFGGRTEFSESDVQLLGCAATNIAAEFPPRLGEDADWLTMATNKPVSNHAYTYKCPLMTSLSQMWGDNPYTADTPICAAALHAAVITPLGGLVAIVRSNEISSFGSSYSPSGFWSQAWEQPYPAYLITAGATMATWLTDATRTVAEMQQVFVCPATDSSSFGAISGLNPYSIDSPVCVAALHAGVITTQGGVVDIWRPDNLIPNFSQVHGDPPGYVITHGAPAVWTTDARDRPNAPGLTYFYSCPATSAPLGPIWGSNPYTTDSPVCVAARHAGFINSDVGGVVGIERTDNASVFASSNANGVFSHARHSSYPAYRILSAWENSISVKGGAMFFRTSNVTIKSSTFTSTQGHVGGAIYASEHTVLNVSESKFRSCSAWTGGAIHATTGSTFRINDSLFFGNSASNTGGALSASDGAVGQVTGAQFCNNTAVNGGAVYSETNATFVGTNSTFFLNAATRGGAMHSRSRFRKVVSCNNCTFYNNSAKYGGALYFAERVMAHVTNSAVAFNEALENGGAALLSDAEFRSENTLFLGNRANVGSAILGTSAGEFVDCVVSIRGCVFMENRAGNMGGAVTQAWTTRNWTISNTTFCGNRALYGGGIMQFHWIDAAAMVLGMDLSFRSNHARNGGAWGVLGDTLGFSSATAGLSCKWCQFRHNTAGFGGGAISSERNGEHQTILLSNCSFQSNNGTAVIIRPSITTKVSRCSITIADSVFNQNAGDWGGGIFTQSVESSLSGVLFTENTALYMGGGLADYSDHLEPPSIVSISKCSFQHNSALVQGGGASFNGDVTISGCTFRHNHVENLEQGLGGGLLALPQSSMTVNHSVFDNNAGAFGANIAVIFGPLRSSMWTNISVTNSNSGVGLGTGAGFFIVAVNSLSECEISIARSIFAANTGAIYVFGGQPFVNISDTQFLNNLHSAIVLMVAQPQVINPSILGQVTTTCTVLETSKTFWPCTRCLSSTVTPSDPNCGAHNLVLTRCEFNSNQLPKSNHLTPGGAALYVSRGTALGRDTMFLHNRADEGAAVLLNGEYASLAVVGCNFTGNFGGKSGALLALNAFLCVERCTFRENAAQSTFPVRGDGGAICFDNAFGSQTGGGQFSIRHSFFINNSATGNGGAWCLRHGFVPGISTGFNPEFRDTVFEENRAELTGGCVAVLSNVNLRASNLTFRRCFCEQTGAAVFENSGLSTQWADIWIYNAIAGTQGAFVILSQLAFLTNVIIENATARSAAGMLVAPSNQYTGLPGVYAVGLSITRCRAGTAAAILVSNQAQFSCTACHIADNVALTGGSIVLRDFVQVSFYNSFIVRNGRYSVDIETQHVKRESSFLDPLHAPKPPLRNGSDRHKSLLEVCKEDNRCGGHETVWATRISFVRSPEEPNLILDGSIIDNLHGPADIADVPFLRCNEGLVSVREMSPWNPMDLSGAIFDIQPACKVTVDSDKRDEICIRDVTKLTQVEAMQPRVMPIVGGLALHFAGVFFHENICGGPVCRFSEQIVPATIMDDRTLTCIAPNWPRSETVRVAVSLDGLLFAPVNGTLHLEYFEPVSFTINPSVGQTSGGTVVTMNLSAPLPPTASPLCRWSGPSGTWTTPTVPVASNTLQLECLTPAMDVPLLTNFSLLVTSMPDEPAPQLHKFFFASPPQISLLSLPGVPEGVTKPLSIIGQGFFPAGVSGACFARAVGVARFPLKLLSDHEGLCLLPNTLAPTEYRISVGWNEAERSNELPFLVYRLPLSNLVPSKGPAKNQEGLLVTFSLSANITVRQQTLLSPTAVCRLGNESVHVLFATQTKIQCNLTSSMTGKIGTHTLQVFFNGVDRSGFQTLRLYPQPNITSMSPSKLASGQTLLIRGSGGFLKAAADGHTGGRDRTESLKLVSANLGSAIDCVDGTSVCVFFGDLCAAAQVDSDEQLSCVVPNIDAMAAISPMVSFNCQQSSGTQSPTIRLLVIPRFEVHDSAPGYSKGKLSLSGSNMPSGTMYCCFEAMDFEFVPANCTLTNCVCDLSAHVIQQLRQDTHFTHTIGLSVSNTTESHGCILAGKVSVRITGLAAVLRDSVVEFAPFFTVATLGKGESSPVDSSVVSARSALGSSFSLWCCFPTMRLVSPAVESSTKWQCDASDMLLSVSQGQVSVSHSLAVGFSTQPNYQTCHGRTLLDFKDWTPLICCMQFAPFVVMVSLLFSAAQSPDKDTPEFIIARLLEPQRRRLAFKFLGPVIGLIFGSPAAALWIVVADGQSEGTMAWVVMAVLLSIVAFVGVLHDAWARAPACVHPSPATVPSRGKLFKTLASGLLVWVQLFLLFEAPSLLVSELVVGNRTLMSLQAGVGLSFVTGNMLLCAFCGHLLSGPVLHFKDVDERYLMSTRTSSYWRLIEAVLGRSDWLTHPWAARPPHLVNFRCLLHEMERHKALLHHICPITWHDLPEFIKHEIVEKKNVDSVTLNSNASPFFTAAVLQLAIAGQTGGIVAWARRHRRWALLARHGIVTTLTRPIMGEEYHRLYDEGRVMFWSYRGFDPSNYHSLKPWLSNNFWRASRHCGLPAFVDLSMTESANFPDHTMSTALKQCLVFIVYADEAYMRSVFLQQRLLDMKHIATIGKATQQRELEDADNFLAKLLPNAPICQRYPDVRTIFTDFFSSLTTFDVAHQKLSERRNAIWKAAQEGYLEDAIDVVRVQLVCVIANQMESPTSFIGAFEQSERFQKKVITFIGPDQRDSLEFHCHSLCLGHVARTWPHFEFVEGLCRASVRDLKGFILVNAIAPEVLRHLPNVELTRNPELGSCAPVSAPQTFHLRDAMFSDRVTEVDARGSTEAELFNSIFYQAEQLLFPIRDRDPGLVSLSQCRSCSDLNQEEKRRTMVVLYHGAPEWHGTESLFPRIPRTSLLANLSRHLELFGINVTNTVSPVDLLECAHIVVLITPEFVEGQVFNTSFVSLVLRTLMARHTATQEQNFSVVMYELDIDQLGATCLHEKIAYPEGQWFHEMKKVQKKADALFSRADSDEFRRKLWQTWTLGDLLYRTATYHEYRFGAPISFETQLINTLHTLFLSTIAKHSQGNGLG